MTHLMMKSHHRHHHHQAVVTAMKAQAVKVRVQIVKTTPHHLHHPLQVPDQIKKDRNTKVDKKGRNLKDESKMIL